MKEGTPMIETYLRALGEFAVLGPASLARFREREPSRYKAMASRDLGTVEAPDGSEVYAYPHQRGIAWGVNAAGSGVNILRGVRRPDGADEAVS
jgi:hypothetical protein